MSSQEEEKQVFHLQIRRERQERRNCEALRAGRREERRDCGCRACCSQEQAWKSYCAGITAFSTFANSVLEAAFVHTTTTDIIAKYVETIAESSCIVVIHEPSIKAFTSNIHKYRDDE